MKFRIPKKKDRRGEYLDARGKLNLAKSKYKSHHESSLIDFSKRHFGLSSFRFLKTPEVTDELKGFLCYGISSNIDDDLKVAIKIIPATVSPRTDTSSEKSEKEKAVVYMDSESYFMSTFSNELLMTGISPNFVMCYDSFSGIHYSQKSFKSFPLRKMYKTYHISSGFNVLLCEYLHFRDIDYWVSMTKLNITSETWKSILFQLIYTLAVLQDKYRFVHHDFHPGNVLIDEVAANKGSILEFIYKGKRYNVKNEGVIPKIWDFEYGSVSVSEAEAEGEIERSESESSGDTESERSDAEGVIIRKRKKPFNPYTDIHFFLRELLTVDNLPEETKQFIKNLYHDDLLLIDQLKAGSSSSTIDHKKYPETKYLKYGRLKLNNVLSDGLTLYTPEELMELDYFSSYLTKSPDCTVDLTFRYPLNE